MCAACNCIGPDAQVCREENVAHTRMNAENIAMVFAPNVLRSSISDPNQVQHGNDRTRATWQRWHACNMPNAFIAKMYRPTL